MTAEVSWFELGHQIAESHARNASNTVSVIPVVVENLQTARPILRALADIHDGCFLDASDSHADPRKRLNVYQPVPGTNDPVRHKAIETALSKPNRAVKVIRQSGSRLDVTFKNSTTAERLSAGDRTLHAIARAAAHKCLDEHSFAIIAYNSGPLDQRSKEAAWNLMVHHVHGTPRKTPQTLVVVTQSEINIEIHCESEYGFRYAIEQGRLLRRQGAAHLRHAATRIVEQSKMSPVVFFLGAGFSVSSRIPLGDTLRDNAIVGLLNDQQYEGVDSIELGIELHNWLSTMPERPEWLSRDERSTKSNIFASELTLERVLAVEKRTDPNLPTLQEFKERHDTVVNNPGSSVHHLAKILRDPDTKIIVAQLNYDCLVERNTEPALKVFASNDEFEKALDYILRYCNGDEDGVPLLKLHGTIDRIETCVATQDETDRGVGEAQFQTLTSLLKISEDRLPWIYVGMSMRDRDLLQVLNTQNFARQLDERWVVPYIVPSVRKFGARREPHWEGTGFESLEDRVITETSDAFFEALATAWL